MKLAKRLVSVALAILMAFSCFSLLASAADSNDIKLEFKFYRLVETTETAEDGTETTTSSWVPTTKVARGETIKARLFADTNYAAASSALFWMYPEDFLTLDYSTLTADDSAGDYKMPLNTAEGSAIVEGAWDIRVVPGTDGAAGKAHDLTCDGSCMGDSFEPYVPLSEFDGYDWFYNSVSGSSAQTLSSGTEGVDKYGDKYWLYELTFTVNENATDKGYIKMHEGSIMSMPDYEYSIGHITKQPLGDGASITDGIVYPYSEDFNWDLSALTAEENLLTVDQAVTFVAGDNGTISGTTSYTGYIGDELSAIGADTADDTSDDFVAPTITANAGYKFVGWSDGTTTYADASTYVVEHEATTLTAVYETTAAPTSGYTVNIYEMDVDGNYPATPEVVPNTTGNVGDEAVYTPTIDAGFYLDTDKSTADLKTTVTEDDTDVINVYLARNTQTVKYVDENGNAIASLADATYRYGKTYNIAAEVAKTGYDWAGWVAGDATFTAGAEATAQPATNGEELVYKASYTAAANTVVINGVYTDAKTGGEVELDPYTVNTTTGYTVKVVDAVPEETEANVTYVLKSALPTATHYQIPAGTVYEVAVADDGKATLEITYEAKSYTYKFVDEDGTTVLKTETVPYFTNVKAPDATDKSAVGKTFNQWVSGDKTLAAGGSFDIEGDVTYTASYTSNKYYVDLVIDGEYPEGFTEPTFNEDGYTYGQTFTLETPKADGYTFLGWEVTGADYDAETGVVTVGTDNISIYAEWTLNDYTITYYLDDAMQVQYGEAVPYYYGDPIEEVVPEQKDILGKRYIGWTYYSADEANTNLGEITEMPAQDVVAVLDYEYYVVTFYDEYVDKADLENSTTYDVISEVETIAAADAPVVESDEFTFVEWRNVADDSAVSFPHDVTSDMDLYPYITVTATFYTDATLKTVHKEYTFAFGHVYSDADFADLGTPADIEGYSFKDWNGGLFQGSAESNVYTYANWTADAYTATFNAVNGTLAGAFTDASTTKTVENVTYDTEITFTEVPVLAGYTFAGWSEDGTTKATTPLMMDAEGKTYTALYTKNGETAYTVEIYLMGTDGAYAATPSKTDVTKTATIGTTVSADHADYIDTLDSYFSADTSEDAGNVFSAVMTADGATLKLYYKRATVEIKVNGETKDYYVGEEIPAPEVDESTIEDGYKQDETDPWVDENGDPVKMPHTVTETGNPTEIKPNIVPKTDTPYTVEIYTMDVTGNYGAAEVVPNTVGTTNTEVTYTPEAAGEGFYIDTEMSTAGYKTTITADDTDVIKVYYARHAYTVTVDGVAQTDKVYYGGTFTAPATSTAITEGYHLAGWTDGTANYAAGDKITVTDNLVLTAVPAPDTDTEYTIEVYEMDVNGNYGDPETETKTAATATEITYTATPATGFYVDEDQSVLKTTVSAGTEDVIKVYYARNAYTVTVDGVAQTNKVYYGGTFTAPAEPTVAEGLEFAGWSDGKTVYQAGDAITVTGNLDLVTTTSANEYEVIFKINNNLYTSTKAAFGSDVENPGTPADEYIPDGYSFEGWSTDGKTVLTDLGTVQVGGNTYLAVLKADEDTPYEIIKYFQTVDGQGWSDADVTPMTGTTGETASVNYNEMTVAGFRIDETISKNNVEITGDGQAKIIIYYLRNTVNVTINGTQKEYFYGSQITEPADPTKEGYTFADAWTYEDGTPVEFPVTVTGDITIVPVWTVNKYSITFVDGTTTLEGPTEVEYGSTIQAPTAPDKTSEGLVFAGWLDADTGATMPEKMPAKNATYKANYVQNGAPVKYTIEVYQMNLAGNYELTATTKASALVGTTQTVEYGEVTGFTFDADNSVLSAVILADGSTVLKVCYARNLYKATFDGVEYDVYFGAALPEVEPAAQTGKTFLGWTPEVPASMPASDLEFTSTWDEITYTITYYINGTTDVVEYAYGADVATPADPVVAGMKFIGWSEDIPDTMPAKNLIIVAEFEASVYNVTFLNADGSVFDKKAVQFGDEITLPTTEPTLEHHTFAGWSGIPADGKMPAQDLEITPVFDRVQVMLIPKNDTCTTVIDRDGLTVNDYVDGESLWYVYGLTDTLTEEVLLEEYIDVQGDGRIEIVYRTKSDGSTHAPFTGTGTVINVYDNVENELVESFTIIIYGDLNGDSFIGAIDGSIADDEVMYRTEWSDDLSDEYTHYMVKAADFDKNGRIMTADSTNIKNTSLGISIIDQTTGSVIEL